MNAINYFNPFSNEFSQASKDFERLSGFNQFLAVTASIFAGLLGLGVSAIAAFRFTVEILPKGEDKIADKIDKVAKQSLSDVDVTSAEDDVDGLPQQLHTAQVQTNGHPQPEPIDLDLESVQSLIENVTYSGPQKPNHLKLERLVYDRTLKIGEINESKVHHVLARKEIQDSFRSDQKRQNC